MTKSNKKFEVVLVKPPTTPLGVNFPRDFYLRPDALDLVQRVAQHGGEARVVSLWHDITPEESIAAKREGWEVDDEAGIHRVNYPQEIDETWARQPLFDSDAAAIRWVVGRAAAGSHVHLRAARLHYGSPDALDAALEKARNE